MIIDIEMRRFGVGKFNAMLETVAETEWCDKKIIGKILIVSAIYTIRVTIKYLQFCLFFPSHLIFDGNIQLQQHRSEVISRAFAPTAFAHKTIAFSAVLGKANIRVYSPS